MGIAGLILGILGAIGCFIPGVVFGAWALALIGVIVSAIGMKKAKAANQSGGAAVAGLVLSIVALVIAIPRLICAIACASAVDSIGKGLGAW
jgi:ABC-type phosphate transport system permease subunit